MFFYYIIYIIMYGSSTIILIKNKNIYKSLFINEDFVIYKYIQQ